MCVCVTVSVSVCVCVCVFLCMVLPSFPWCDWLAVEPCQLLLLLGGLLGHLHGVHLQAEFHHRVGPLVQVLLLGLFLNGGLVVVVVVIVVFVVVVFVVVVFVVVLLLLFLLLLISPMHWDPFGSNKHLQSWPRKHVSFWFTAESTAKHWLRPSIFITLSNLNYTSAYFVPYLVFTLWALMIKQYIAYSVLSF